MINLSDISFLVLSLLSISIYVLSSLSEINQDPILSSLALMTLLFMSHFCIILYWLPFILTFHSTRASCFLHHLPRPFICWCVFHISTFGPFILNLFFSIHLFPHHFLLCTLILAMPKTPTNWGKTIVILHTPLYNVFLLLRTFPIMVLSNPFGRIVWHIYLSPL